MTRTNRDDFLTYAADELGAEPDYVFDDFPMWSVLRHGNKGKWFALLADVDYGKLDLDQEGTVDIAVVKADPPLIDSLTEKPGYTRGYHMDKKNWVTILLDGSVPIDDALDLLKGSFDLTK